MKIYIMPIITRNCTSSLKKYNDFVTPFLRHIKGEDKKRSRYTTHPSVNLNAYGPNFSKVRHIKVTTLCKHDHIQYIMKNKIHNYSRVGYQ